MYIDELILMNFFIDYILLKALSKLLKINVKNKRIIFASIIGEIYLLFVNIDFSNFLLVLIKLILCIIMIICAFGYNDYKTLIKNIIYYYIISFFLGGILFYLKTENLLKYKYVIFLIPTFIHIYEYFEYYLKDIINTRYKVTIYLNNGDVLYLTGFMDTGNSLIEPYSHKKVIIINKEVNEKYFLVPYSTINNNSYIKCFNPKKVYIDKIGQRNDICVGVVNKKFNGYNCLLNYKIMEE